ncbi:nuclear receptor coactivator 5-like [Lampetra fluviatilis]
MDSERLREELYLRYYAMLKKQARDTRVVDCIVIASNRSIADYAESVGHKVRNRGLYVDLMFLVSEASLPSALEEATRSGSAYAVVVSIQHQLHRSCTLNILQGTPEEHRNMPLLDALRLLQRHFESTRGLERERQDSELPIRAAEMANVAIRGDPPGLPPAPAAASSASARSGGWRRRWRYRYR